MGVVGRNELCHCGSGKKYKKCCMNNDEISLSVGALPVHFDENNFNAMVTNHDIKFGIKEMVLALMEQIDQWLAKKHIHQQYILENSQDLLRFATTDNMYDHYLKIHREVLESNVLFGTMSKPKIPLELKRIGDAAKHLPSLTDNERFVLAHVSQSTLAEFMMLTNNKTADYSGIKIFNDFCYQAIKEGIPDNGKYVTQATFYVDSNGDKFEKLINWELKFSNEPVKHLWVNWKPLDKLNDEYRKIAHSLHGLEEQSKNDLATVMFQEKSMPAKSKNRISYRGLITTYTGILEKELKLLIELNEGKKMPELMFKKINEYLRGNEIPYVTENIINLYDQLEEIRKIRNEAAHGNEVSYEDFLKVKNFVMDRRAFEFISWAKIEYEDDSGN